MPVARKEANDVIFHALGLLGTPYKWGGNTPQTGFDCSGLVKYVYGKTLDIDLPRTSRAMARLGGRKIKNTDNLKSGDLLFFRTSGGSRISHVAIYLGNGRFIHAPNSDETVKITKLSNPYWHRHFAFAKRILPK